MNKELIKKYKKEFDYDLSDGKILMLYTSGKILVSLSSD
jgi:hypothetical protein